MAIAESELIINPNGSIYHLNLKPEDIADTVIFVGDQERVAMVSKHFDSIDLEVQTREFKTQTGTYKGKRISVISTGIGPDNIDIVLNELDALVNIDFKTRQIKSELKSLNIIRIGTSGSLQEDIPVDSFLLSTHSLDINGMLQAYKTSAIAHPEIESAFIAHTQWHQDKARPLIIENSKTLQHKIDSDSLYKGITATAGGFYGPQGRILRLSLKHNALIDKISSFKFEGLRITNLEMETSAIYGLSQLLGHNAVSLNAILANRANGKFSNKPRLTIERLIEYALVKIVS